MVYDHVQKTIWQSMTMYVQILSSSHLLSRKTTLLANTSSVLEENVPRKQRQMSRSFKRMPCEICDLAPLA